MVNFLVVFAGAFLISAIAGTIWYMQDTKWGPRQREKMFGKSPFKELLQNGFVRKDHLLYGSVNGYSVPVQYTWPGGRSAIKVDVLFDPNVAGQLLTGEMIKALRKKIKPENKLKDPAFEWTRNSVGQVFEYMIKPPKYEKIIKSAQALTEKLLLEGLKPIKFEDAQKLSDPMS